MNRTHVYWEFTQAELDEQYNNRARFPDYPEQFEKWRNWSHETRQSLPCELDVPVGESEFQRIDIFPAEFELSPIYVFIKGGYWYSLDKGEYSYIAEGMRPHGLTTVTLNFGLAPDHDMDTIVAHCRSAMIWLWQNAASMGADRNRIYVGGHSAGGHLAMNLLGTDWPGIDPDIPIDLIKGVCSIGGLHDLEPISQSFLNEKLKLTDEQVAKYSPVSLEYAFPAHLLLIAAIDESPELHRQSRIMHARWQDLGYPGELLVPENADHFNVVNELRHPDCPLVTKQLESMQIAFSRSGSSENS